MNKQEALQRLSRLEHEASELRKIIDAPASLLNANDPSYTRSFAARFDDNTLRFKEAATAHRYGVAVNTLIKLRHQNGTVAPDGRSTERSVAGNLTNHLDPYYSTTDGRWRIKISKYSGCATKLGRISPCFETETDAVRALQNIGEDTLLEMFFTLHHFTPNQSGE